MALHTLENTVPHTASCVRTLRATCCRVSKPKFNVYAKLVIRTVYIMCDIELHVNGKTPIACNAVSSVLDATVLSHLR